MSKNNSFYNFKEKNSNIIEKQLGKKNSRARQVLDKRSGLIFNTVNEAAVAAGITQGALSNMLSGRRNNTTQMEYCDTPPFQNAKTLDEVIDEFLRSALAYYGGNITKTAKMVGVSRATLNRHLKKTCKKGKNNVDLFSI